MRRLFLEGVAQHLAAAGVGVWRPSGSYPPGEAGIVVAARPQEPGDVISLSAYGVDDDPSLSDSVLGLQVWCRRAGAHPGPVAETADAVFDVLHGTTHLALVGGVHVVQCLRRSQVSGGQDGNGRWSDIQNFYATVHYPSTHRL